MSSFEFKPTYALIFIKILISINLSNKTSLYFSSENIGCTDSYTFINPLFLRQFSFVKGNNRKL